jgi:hypothetical protein
MALHKKYWQSINRPLVGFVNLDPIARAQRSH